MDFMTETRALNEGVTSDADLVRMAREHDREAFGQLVQRHRGACLRFATFLLRDRGEAEEEVQNAFWKAFEHLDQFKGGAEFPNWLSRIVANNCMMRLRTRARARLLPLDGYNNGSEREGSIDLPAASSDPELGLIQSQVASLVGLEIRRIPTLFRDVVLLRDVYELPISDVATRLGITVPAAKSRLFRARNELRRRVLERCGARCRYTARSAVQVIPARSTRCPVASA
jgi:RNA polymerase sigma-70 factor, ECF subfamily